MVFAGIVVFTLVPREEKLDYVLPDFDSRLAGEDLEFWTWKDLPLSESEEVLNRIGEQLAFDEGIYRVYRNGRVSVAVWAAYWRPEGAHIMQVHTHEPDSCWVGGGWAIDQREDRYTFDWPGDRSLTPAKYRLMAKPEGKVHVAFWHLVGGVNLKIDRTEGSLTKYPKIIRQTGIQNKGEQYFLRISSTHPFDELMSDPDFRKILASVADNGLWEG